MRDEIAMSYPDWRRRWPRVRVICREGKPYEGDDLVRICIGCAKRIVVLGASKKPRVADSLAITALCALQVT